MLTPEIRAFIENSEQKALATTGNQGLNVVPVSAAHIIEDTIVLCDFFMSKTAEHAKHGCQAALALWKGFEGIQIKGQLIYETEGDRFDQIFEWAKKKYPERTLSGVLVLLPKSVFDLAPGNAGKRIS